MTSLFFTKKTIRRFKIKKAKKQRSHFFLINKKNGIKILLMFKQIVFLHVDDDRLIFYNYSNINDIKKDFNSFKRKLIGINNK